MWLNAMRAPTGSGQGKHLHDLASFHLVVTLAKFQLRVSEEGQMD